MPGIKRLREGPSVAPAADAPRIGLFLFDCCDPERLRAFVEHLPAALDARIAEIVVMLDRPPDAELPPPASLLAGRPLELVFHRPPRALGAGAVRKAAFEYALLKDFDLLVAMRGDGVHAPEALAALFEQLQAQPPGLVLVTRDTARAPLARALRHRLSTFVQNRILGLRLRDYHTRFRVYPRDALLRIPFQLDADDDGFDAEIVIQFRTLGAPIRELALLEATPGDGSGYDDLRHGLRACATAIGLRLHQAHVTRDGRYLVDHDIHYTLKLSETGSHMQIVAAIRPDSSVLDLGCSQGLLARPLRDKNVRVTGVDVGAGTQLARELAEYHRRDLEQPLELPSGRVFDYVVCADVIEHLRNRTPLLRSARRYLKQDGRLIISTPNVALWFYRLSLLVGRFEYGPRGVLDESHVHLFTRSTFRREVEKAGFRVVRQRVTALPFEVVFRSTGRSRLIRALASGYHLLARAWPSLFAYQFVLEAAITTLDEESTATHSA